MRSIQLTRRQNLLTLFVGVVAWILAAALPILSNSSSSSRAVENTPHNISGSSSSNNHNRNVEVTADGRLIEHNNAEEALLDQELKNIFEDTKRTLAAYNDEKSKLLAISTNIIDGEKRKDGIASKMKEIEGLKNNITTTTERVDTTIREINARQILDLKAKVEVLYKRELQRRAKMKEKEELEEKRKQILLDYSKKKKQSKQPPTPTIPKEAIKKEELRDLIDLKGLLQKSDEELESWFLQLVDMEVEALQGELEETVIDSTTALGEMQEKRLQLQKKAEEKQATKTTTKCPGATLVDAVRMVQDSLVKFSKDKVGMVDHLARAKVVHHLTSDNYVPPSSRYFALEESWWFAYLPDDWERGLDAILPHGWRRWNVAVPDYIYHTFRMPRRAQTAPPEVILQPSIHPGSCWPMNGRSGQVTLRLPYPVKVEAVTIDHASALLLSSDDYGTGDEENNNYSARSSAPKAVRVFGYPPCWLKKDDIDSGLTVKKSDYLDDYDDGDDDDDDDEYVPGICDDGLDFDVKKPIVLHDFVYDLDGPTIQTFYIPHPAAAEEDKADDDHGGSCSEYTGTCGGDGSSKNFLFASPDRSDSINEGVTAIRLEITDNWGNKDYTCIYRFRIHGVAIDLNE